LSTRPGTLVYRSVAGFHSWRALGRINRTRKGYRHKELGDAESQVAKSPCSGLISPTRNLRYCSKHLTDPIRSRFLRPCSALDPGSAIPFLVDCSRDSSTWLRVRAAPGTNCHLPMTPIR